MESLRELVARVLAIDPQTLNDEASPENISSWDSFNGLMLVSELEKNFNVQFTIDEIMSVTKYKDIKDALKRHGIANKVDD